MESLERLIKAHTFLEGLTEPQMATIVGCARNRRVKSGQYLMREGARSDEFFLVRSGEVALEIHLPGRGATIMESLGAGDILGFSWLNPPYLSQLDARARTEVAVIAFDGACLRRKMEHDHDLGYAITRRLLPMMYRRLERVRLQRIDVYKAD